MQTLIDDYTLLHNFSGVQSPTFLKNVADDFIGMYPNDNRMNLDENSSDSDIVKRLDDQMNFSPDGWIVFVNKEHEKEVKELIHQEFINAYKNDELNFTNGDVSESVLYHKVAEGLILEMFDPEYQSSFLETLVDKLKKIDQNLMAFEMPHMSSHISELIGTPYGQPLIDILDVNNIYYDK